MVPPRAAAAPIDIEANRASAPPRSDQGHGICTTAVHLNQDDLLTGVEVAEAYLAQSVGMNRVDGKVSFPYATIDFRNSAPTAGGDYPDNRPLPFTALPGTPQVGNERNIAMRVRGYINIYRPGIFTFAVLADDGYRLRIGGKDILSSVGFASLRDSRQVRFAAQGLYPIELVYFQNTGPAMLELSYADREDLEVQHSPTPLGGGFSLVPQAALFSAVAGRSDCTECNDDATCGPTMGRYCRDGLCQPCIVPARCGQNCQPCPASQPVCNGSACVECSASDTSVCDRKGFVCELNTCRPCLADSECGNGRICDIAFGQCIPRPNLRYAGGCSVAPGGQEPALVVPLLLLALGLLIVGAQRLRSRSALAALVLLVGAGQARAQQSLEVARFNAQTFRPAMGPGNVFTVEGTLMPRRLFPFGGLFFQYAHHPLRLVVEGTGETYAYPVSLMLTAHLMPGFGITRWWSVGLDLPVVMYQGFDERTPAADTNFTIPAAGGVGDLRLMTKFRILNNEGGGFGLAAVPQFVFPTGAAASPNSFRSEDTVGIEPRIAADYRFRNGIFIALNLGYWLRTYNRNVDFGVVRVADQIRYALGMGAPILKGFGVAGEMSGAISLSRLDGGPLYSPLEGFAGLRYTHSSGLEASVGGGGAFVSAVGIPLFRAFASIAFVPTGKRPERRVEPRPELQDLDPDGDGVQGVEDECPSKAGPRENRGCPDKDQDRDGIVDRLDRCPKEAGPSENEGCPDTDSDQDGIVDRLDKCPTESGVAQHDGCPELDTDKDGILDKDDRCPAQPGVADNQGCPDTDEDKDTIVDRLDRCPKEAGPRETSGCPVLQVSDNRVRLVLPIRFAPGKDTPQKESDQVIMALAQLMAQDSSIKKLQIEVPASGDKKTAKKLAGKRAKNLLGLLVDAEVSKKRLAIKAAKRLEGDEITEVTLNRGKVKDKKGKKAKAGKKGKKAK
ncbi:MAG: thrombospondin type 3 repeat-containing protein [Myxococcales bacterium]|nr:thrombospondin type 3 repeat-containing protein [Myxococcales bacterium]